MGGQKPYTDMFKLKGNDYFTPAYEGDCIRPVPRSCALDWISHVIVHDSQRDQLMGPKFDTGPKPHSS